MKWKALFIFTVLSGSVFAQPTEVQEGDFVFDLSGGFNYSRLNLSEIQMKQGLRPFMGLRSTYVLAENWHLNGISHFAMKASQINSQKGIQQIGMDFQLYPQYKWDDLYFNAGLVYDWPINSGFYTFGSTSEGNRVNRVDYETPSPHLSIIIGFEFKLMDHWRLGTNFYVPTRAEATNNLQFVLSYQLSKRSAKNKSARRIRKRTAARQIRQLRNGALLVRLKTSQPKIEAMRVKGLEKEAEKVAKEQRMENLRLIRAFERNYHFSEVRFFMSYDSKKIKNKNFEGVFVNDSLTIDSNIVLRNRKNIFIAEYAQLEPDTAIRFSHYEWVQTGNFSAVQEPRFYGGSENTFMALVIRDEEFKQLHRPFPYYSRALYIAMKDHPGHGIFYFPVRLFSPMSENECIKNLNDKLYRFWEKNKR